MITENYIKMCEKNEDLQHEWRTENGDYVYWKITKSIKIITDHFYTPNLKDFTWLPTQEQLQEILYNYYQLNNSIKGLTIGDSISKYMIATFSDFVSYSNLVIFNELWLAFVMYEKWNKIWTGEKWVKANE